MNGALVRFIYPRPALGRGIGVNALVVAGSSAAGPSVAAAIMSVLSWPWLFALQVPAGGLALWLAHRFLPQTPRAGHPFDPLSAVLNAVTFGLFITALDGIGRGQGPATVLSELTVSIIVGWFFVQRRLRARADAAGRPVPPPRVRAFGGGRDLRARGTADRIHSAAILLPVHERPVADRDRLADHAVAGRACGGGADRRAAGGSALGRVARRTGPRGDDAGPSARAVHARTTGADRRGLEARRVRHRIRILSVAKQPADDRQRSAGSRRSRQRHAVDLTPARPDDGQRHWWRWYSG